MKISFSTVLPVGTLLASLIGCDARHEEVVDLNKVVSALVAVLDEGNAPKVAGIENGGGAIVTATDAKATEPNATEPNAAGVDTEFTAAAEIKTIEPDKQDPTKEADFLKKYAAKLNEMKVMQSPVGVNMTAGGEIVGFRDSNQNMIQDMDESKEFTVTIDAANHRFVASDNHGYHRPHGYGFNPGGMMMGYMLGSMMGRQNNYYSGAMAQNRPSFSNTTMSPANYHQSAVKSVRTSRTTSSSGTTARARTGSKGFSFGK